MRSEGPLSDVILINWQVNNRVTISLAKILPKAIWAEKIEGYLLGQC
ncbi:MAG TPA: hypothetical protein VF974_03905 [Patescibacteria group bacterium]